jgi:hypothetical protein
LSKASQNVRFISSRCAGTHIYDVYSLISPREASGGRVEYVVSPKDAPDAHFSERQPVKRRTSSFIEELERLVDFAQEPAALRNRVHAEEMGPYEINPPSTVCRRTSIQLATTYRKIGLDLSLGRDRLLEDVFAGPYYRALSASSPNAVSPRQRQGDR